MFFCLSVFLNSEFILNTLHTVKDENDPPWASLSFFYHPICLLYYKHHQYNYYFYYFVNLAITMNTQASLCRQRENNIIIQGYKLLEETIIRYLVL